MSFSYSGNPGASLQDQVRFLLGDTNAAQPLLQDGEIQWLLADANEDPLAAAIRACDSICGLLARNRDETVGSVSIKFSQQLAGYAALAGILRRKLGRRAAPWAGGISISQKASERYDADRVKPSFTKDMFKAFPDDQESAVNGFDDTDGGDGVAGGFGI